MIRVGAPLAALLLAASGTALAQESEPVEFRHVSDRDEVVLDPAKTYLLVESPMLAMPSFIVLPTEEQSADWARQRAEALAEAVEEYPDRMLTYERNMRVWRETQGRVGRRPVLPVEPTEESFPWPDLESRRIGATGPLNRFFKSDELNLWLSEVPPGEYVFYGYGFGPAAVVAGTCTCMGSVRFTVEPGKVTALRTHSRFLDAAGNRMDRPPEGSNATDIMTRQVLIIEPATDAIYDPRIPRERVVRPEFRTIEILPNWFGGTIARVEPIEGVLRYERDRMIDLRPQPELQAPAEQVTEPVAQLPEAEPEPLAPAAEAPLADVSVNLPGGARQQ